MSEKPTYEELEHRVHELEKIELEYKRTVEASRISKALLKEIQLDSRELFDSVGDAIFFHDSSGKIIEVNKEACKRYGYTRDQLKEMAANQIDSPEECKKIPERFRLLKEKGHLSFETIHLDKEGNRIICDVTARLVNYQG